MRKKSMAVVWGLLALALAPSHAGAAQAEVTKDSVSAHGNWFYTEFDLDASSDPFGGQPTGYVNYVIPDSPYAYYGPVTCLAVNGSDAVVVFRNENPDTQFFRHGTWFLRDGEPTGAPDELTGWFQYEVLARPDVCSTDLGGRALYPFDGELVVQDAVCEKFKDKPGDDKDKCKT